MAIGCEQRERVKNFHVALCFSVRGFQKSSYSCDKFNFSPFFGKIKLLTCFKKKNL